MSRPRRRGPRAGASLFAAVTAAATLSACVVVDDGTAGPRANGRAVDLGGPVATAALDAEVVNSRVVVGVKRLGAIPFAGQLLPLTSPDGRYVATQTGEPVDWETLLAGPGQAVTLGGVIRVFALEDDAVREIEPAEPIPPGAILGRSADDAGFLIERVLPDGSRTAERVGWLTGRRVRVSSGDAGIVSAHATLMPRHDAGTEPPSGGAVWTSRDIDGASVGIASVAGPVRREPNAAYRLPTADAWPAEIHAIRASNNTESSAGSVLVGMRLEPARTTAADAVRAAIVRRVRISERDDPVIAFQALGSLQSPTPIALTGAPPDTRIDPRPPGFLFFHPARARMAILDRFSGAIVNLEEGSSAGAWHAHADSQGRIRWGIFVTTPDGLRYQAIRGGDSRQPLEALRGAVVLDESYVPRATSDPDWPWILIGPNRRDPLKLDILRMRVVGSR